MTDINLVAPCNTVSYGIVSYNLMKALDAEGLRVNLFPIAKSEVEKAWVPLLQKCEENAASFHPTAPSIRVWHQHEMLPQAGKGKHIGFPIFELDRFTEREQYHLFYCDELFVCSGWAKTVVQNALQDMGQPWSYSEKRVHVIPLGVDREIFHKKEDGFDRPFRFLNVGKWEVRKGHDFLASVFKAAFPTEKVELWMAPFSYFADNERWMNTYKEILGDRVQFVDRAASQHDVADLMQRCDAGIFPSRAEGWNLPLLEMMSCGKPCITTGYSGHTEFCTKDNSLPIRVEETEAAHDGIWFHGQGNWAKLEQEHFGQMVEYMRSLYKDRESTAIQRVKSEATKTAEKFSWENTAKRIIKSLGLCSESESNKLSSQESLKT